MAGHNSCFIKCLYNNLAFEYLNKKQENSVIYSLLITFSIKFHFCFFWQVYFEVHILEHLPADFGDDHQETDPHVVRVGWSIDSSSFQLGMYIFLAATTT